GEAGSQLVVPYSLTTNDMRFVTAPGFSQADDFFQLLRDSFDCLYAEGQDGAPKMMSVGLHCRLAGQPSRLEALRRFILYIHGFERVWIATRLDIARHWAREHPYRGSEPRPSQLGKADFVSRYGSVFE